MDMEARSSGWGQCEAPNRDVSYTECHRASWVSGNINSILLGSELD